MFTKILIANRGEIACRVIKTARKMGIKTVAVYSDADAGAKHVAACDEAVHIGGSAPGDSYLRWERIIEAARATGEILERLGRTGEAAGLYEHVARELPAVSVPWSQRARRIRESLLEPSKVLAKGYEHYGVSPMPPMAASATPATGATCGDCCGAESRSSWPAQSPWARRVAATAAGSRLRSACGWRSDRFWHRGTGR